MFDGVLDILSHYCQYFSESGIVIFEITRCQALPLRSPEWNLRFGSCMSLSWSPPHLVSAAHSAIELVPPVFDLFLTLFLPACLVSGCAVAIS